MKQVNNFSILGKLNKITIAALGMGLVVWFLESWRVSVLISIPLAVVFYFGFLLVLKESIISDLKNFLNVRSSH